MDNRYTAEKIKDFTSKQLFSKEIIFKKDQSWPKISVVIPSYNKGQFLEKTILSVLNQNYPNLELIVIDGGSTDESIGVIKKYEKYLAFWVSEKDRGQSDALNKGFLKARGDLINEQDADDIFLPGAFYKIVKVFKENPLVDVIYGNRLDIDEKDNIIGETRYTRFSSIIYRYDGMSIGPQSALWRGDLFSKVGEYDISLPLSMDYDFFMRAAIKKAKFRYVPYFFGAMRRYSGSKTTIFLGTKEHQQECDSVDHRYGKKRWLSFPLKIYALFLRSIYYFLQGDGDYVINGLKRRIKSKSLVSGR